MWRDKEGRIWMEPSQRTGPDRTLHLAPHANDPSEIAIFTTDEYAFVAVERIMGPLVAMMDYVIQEEPF